MTNIEIPRWDAFQHYKTRDPSWIKVYTRLMSDQNFTNLTFGQRGLLLSLWLEYARGAQTLPEKRMKLSRAVGGTVRDESLKALDDAGFIVLTSRVEERPRVAAMREFLKPPEVTE